MRARRREADFQQVVIAAPGVQHRAPAALPMRVDQRLDRRQQPGCAERLHHQFALPHMIFGERPMLHGAAAAGAEMLADRLSALMARPLDMHQVAPVGVAGDRFDRHDLARQRIGYVDRPFGGVGHAVAAIAEAGNGELLSHARRLAGIRHCRRRRRSARG